MIELSCEYRIYYNQWWQNIFRIMYRMQCTVGKNNVVHLLSSVFTKTIFNVRARTVSFKMTYIREARAYVACTDFSFQKLSDKFTIRNCGKIYLTVEHQIWMLCDYLRKISVTVILFTNMQVAIRLKTHSPGVCRYLQGNYFRRLADKFFF